MNRRTPRVIAMGRVHSRYLRVLAGLPDGRPVAVPVSGLIRDANVASMADLENISCTNQPRVDLLVNASATESHMQNFQWFRGTNCVALVEELLAASADALEAVQSWPEIASAFVAALLRFTQSLQEAERVLPEVGQVTSVNVVCRLWLPSWHHQSDHRVSCSADVDHGAVLLDPIHETDNCLRPFGAPLQVGAVLRSGTAIDVQSDASSTLLWRFDEFDLNVDLDFLSRQARRELSISATRKRIVWNALDAGVTVYHHDQGTCLVESFPDDWNRDLLLQREIMAAVDSQLAGRSCTFEEARLSLQVCDIARSSSVRGGRLMERGAAL